MTDLSDDLERPTASKPVSAFERTISPISGRLGAGKSGKALVLTGLVAGCGLFVAASWSSEKPKTDPSVNEPARQVVPFEPLKTTTAPTLSAPGEGAPQLSSPSGGPAVPALRTGPSVGAQPVRDQRRVDVTTVRSAPILVYSRTGGVTANPAPAATADFVPALQSASVEGQSELDQLRRGSTIGQARAKRLPDRNFLIVAGAAIPCVLQTAMDTATPGYVSCIIPRDVMSDNGAVVLLEKGSKVLGEYRSNLRQGQRRLFVLWTRAVSPAGVAISLASPASDPVGRAGFDGDLDSHFWQRFGGALLLTIVDDATIAATGQNGAPGTTRLPSDAAGIALQNSINIPPSLRKMQGSEVSIFVAQDFDFSGVYGLRAR